MNESLESIKLIQQLFTGITNVLIHIKNINNYDKYIMESMIYCFNLTYLLLKSIFPNIVIRSDNR
jgi:hypothetical protein